MAARNEKVIDMYAMMKLDQIQIPDFYKKTPPRKEKLDDRMTYYLENGTLSSNIVITQRGLLIDGYCNYMVAVMCGVSVVQCRINTKRLNDRMGGKKRKINNPMHKRKVIYKNQGGKCAFCGKELQVNDYTSQNNYLTLDHILPVSRGGSNGLKNLQGLCRQCNCKKQDDYEED